MLLDTIKNFNWVDIVFIILIIRIGYSAFKGGFPVEIFKLLGTLLATYLAMHYYLGLSSLLQWRIPIIEEKIPGIFFDFVCFLPLAFLGYLVFMILRVAFWRLLKLEAVPRLNKWGGIFLGGFRVVLLGGLICYVLTISSFQYFRESVQNSFFGPSLAKISVSSYRLIWDAFASKFMVDEQYNSAASEAFVDQPLQE